METRVDEIADGIFRLSTFVADVGPSGFTFNQFLIDDDEPMVFHTGPRALFPSSPRRSGRSLRCRASLDRLRAPRSRRVWRDEPLPGRCAPRVAHGALGCMVSLNDLADRPPVPLAEGQVLDLGRHRVRHIDHACGWETRVLSRESTATLLCGDLFTQLGDPPPLVSDDVVEAAAHAEDIFGASCLTPQTAPTIRQLAELAPRALAIMHGSSFVGDGEAALNALADDYAARLGARS